VPRRESDAFGAALLDWVRGGSVPEVVEREDGKFEEGAGPDAYVTDLKGWPPAERKTIRHMRGRIVDVGCGAGRVSLELQRRGLDVTAIDDSQLAVRAAREFGVDDVRLMSLETLTHQIAAWDSVILYGNNFGLFRTPSRARQLLTRWARDATPGTRIFAESTNAYTGGAPIVDRAYYRRNRDRGDAPGAVRFRIHYRDLSSPLVQWLFVSQGEMRRIVRGTGWVVARTFSTGLTDPYVVMLEKPG